MATQIDPKDLDLQEQLARIRKMIDESDKARAESNKAQIETKFEPLKFYVSAALGAAGLMGAGAALAKIFFP